MRKQLDRMVKHSGLVRNLSYGRSAYIVPVLRRSEGDVFPICYFNEIIPWSFDCWPYEYDQWEAFYRRIRVRLAFISARDSVAEMQRRLPEATFVWSPEAVDPTKYRPGRPLTERGTTLLELGRKYVAFHEVARPVMESLSVKHLYEPAPGVKIFGPSEEELAEGMGDAMISVCYPASITHPEWAQGLETVTYRYFQSIASKCVLVGHAPQELVDLFGYNPVIQAESAQLEPQLHELVRNIGDYQKMVDRNYERLLEVGTWDVRAKAMVEAIDRAGLR
jgi:hypothetical protein